jgi:hypothetical protein
MTTTIMAAATTAATIHLIRRDRHCLPFQFVKCRSRRRLRMGHQSTAGCLFPLHLPRVAVNTTIGLETTVLTHAIHLPTLGQGGEGTFRCKLISQTVMFALGQTRTIGACPLHVGFTPTSRRLVR